MNVTSTSGMLKLFAVELAGYLIAFYLVTVTVFNNTISMTSGLLLVAIVTLVPILVDHHLLDI